MDWGLTLGSTYFNSLDIIIFCLTIIGGISGAFQGFAKSFTSKAGILVGLIVALMFTKPVAELISTNFPISSALLISLIAYLITFLLGYWIMLWLGATLSKIMDKLGLSVVDGLLGFVFGGLLTFFVCAGIVYLFSFQSLLDLSSITEKSYMYNSLIMPLIPEIVDRIK
ncbi:MAG: CvpA family protein [Spirochaetaceae bacterium]|nr:CvpA family protein [Spirochaetaceae bacterium]